MKKSNLIQLDDDATDKKFTKKDEQIKTLKEITHEKESIMQIMHNFFVDMNNLHQLITKLEFHIEKCNNHITSVEAEWKNDFSIIVNKLETLDKAHRAIRDKYEALLLSRLKSIAEQEKTSAGYTLQNMKTWIKYYLRPKLGILHQYNPRPLDIPKKYVKPIKLTNEPSVSIITPSFNQDEYLEETITSVVNQNYSNLEYIIQDGGSSDNSSQIIKKYEKYLKFWESQPDKGQSNALNLGFQKSTGDIMAYLNSDDILLPGALQYIVAFFNRNPSIDVVYGHRIVIDKYSEEIGRWVLPKHDENVLRWADYIPQETLFWRRSIWEKAGNTINEKFLFAMDWDLILRFQAVGARFFRLPRFLGCFRAHEKQKTSMEINHAGEEEMRLIREHLHHRKISPHAVQRNIKRYLIKHIIYNKLYDYGFLRY